MYIFTLTRKCVNLRPQEKFSFFSPDFHETHQYLTPLRANFARQISSKSISKYRIPFTTAKQSADFYATIFNKQLLLNFTLHNKSTKHINKICFITHYPLTCFGLFCNHYPSAYFFVFCFCLLHTINILLCTDREHTNSPVNSHKDLIY